MIDDPHIHRRRSMRLKGYDYALPGAYFVTIVTHGRECLLSEIRNGEVDLLKAGEIVDEYWRGIPGHFSNVELGACVVMPNHVHGIIFLQDTPGRGVVSTPNIAPTDNKILPGISAFKGDEKQSGDETQKGDGFEQGDETSQRDGETPPLRRVTLGQVVAWFKYQTTKQVNVMWDSAGVPLWQRNYYDHIIRSEEEYQRIFDYIASNPVNWMDDDENPAR